MAHAALTSGGVTGSAPSGLPDVFDARVHRTARVAIPVVMGLVYGVWAATNRRDGGPLTVWNILFGVVTALAFIVLCLAVARFAPLLTRELHSLVKSAFAGAAVGFLVSQSGQSVLRCAALGAAVMAGSFVAFFYRYYTREEADGDRVG
ncbi:hypothetical protein [Streptomyces sp. NPDC005423]|uniref:hypothetical protein n=1 Tax=Streptomyces sp. NPDC005423 TaxID=3155343 RepID=UPI0033A73342